MMKRIAVALIFLLTMVPLTVSAAPAPQIILNGQPVDFSPKGFTRNNITMVPFRQLFEAYDAKVEWVAETQTVIATKNETTIQLTMDSLDAYVNGEKHTLSQTPFILNGTTYVNFRFISEALGATVSFTKDPYLITIDWTPEATA